MTANFTPQGFNTRMQAELAIKMAGLTDHVYSLSETMDEHANKKFVPVFVAHTLDDLRVFSMRSFACAYEPLPSEYESYKVAFVSTMHISPSSMDLLMTGVYDGYIHKEGFGLMIRNRPPHDPSFGDFPHDVRAVFEKFKNEDVGYIVFDRDTATMPGLKVYEW